MRGDRDFAITQHRGLYSVTMLPSIDEFKKKTDGALRSKHFTNLLRTDILSQEAEKADDLFDMSRHFRVIGRVGSVLAKGNETIDAGLETEFNHALLVAVSLNDELYTKIAIDTKTPVAIFQNMHGEESVGGMPEFYTRKVLIEEEKEDDRITDRMITVECSNYSLAKMKVTIGGRDIIGFILYHTEATNPGTYASPYTTDSFAVTWPLGRDSKQAEERMQDAIRGIAHHAKMVQDHWDRAASED